VAVAHPAAGRLPARRPAAGDASVAGGAGRFVAPAATAAVLALAAVLRLAALSRVPTNPYYDAAVRSMGTSWSAFLEGAFEPGRRVAIDKPPVDLWLQVASTKLLGFHTFGLLLPEALGGVALVAAVMWLLRGLYGRGAALAGGLALAVLPSAVVVARSDTMDAVMAALATCGVALVARAARTGRLWPLAGAGALLGLAFDVKLAEALLAVLATAVLWLAAGPRHARRRGRGLALAGTAFTATALAWLIVVTVVPAHPRPWALGASNGSPWNAALVYNGIDRLVPGRSPSAAAAAAADPASAAPTSLASAASAAPTRLASAASAATTASAARAAPASLASAATATTTPLRGPDPTAVALARRAGEHAAAVARRPAAAGPLRLLSSQAHLATWIGIEAVAALAALAVALALGAWRTLDRVQRGGLVALGLWLVGGLALCSVLPALRPRYLACVDPAVAAGLGAGVALALRARPRPAQLAGVGLLCAVLVVPTATAVAAVRHATQDAGRTGAMPAPRLAALSAFLRGRTHGAADELAVSAPAKAGALIARDGRPVLILSDGQGHQLVTPSQLKAAVAAKHVRFALLGDACSRASGNARTGCLPVVRWARGHGVDVSRAAGQPHRGALYALGAARRASRPRRASSLRPLTGPGVGGAGCGRTPTSARSPRTGPAAAGFVGRRASRARRRRDGRARHASRPCSSSRRSR
jgi:4-amino-4-deoxy-L-arabinose transferase-like glycosyltransferase